MKCNFCDGKAVIMLPYYFEGVNIQLFFDLCSKCHDELAKTYRIDIQETSR